MIYEYLLKKEKTVVVPVRAKDEFEANDIFEEWYDESSDEIDELFDNADVAYEIQQQCCKDEKDYNMANVMLPKESDHPIEMRFQLTVKYLDGTVDKYHDYTFRELINVYLDICAMNAWRESNFIIYNVDDGNMLCREVKNKYWDDYKKQRDKAVKYSIATPKDLNSAYKSAKYGRISGGKY